MKRFSLFGLRS